MFVDNSTLILDIYRKIPPQIYYILSAIEIKGYEVYIVGGAIRDLFLGKQPHDWDIATNAPMKVLTELFPNYKIVGESFGVVLVKIGEIEVQIAKFRTENEYSDYRHPDIVDFDATVEKDLKRRDFTINAIALNTRGIKSAPESFSDLNEGLIRSVGNPDERFMEDPLRMLRAIRFSCQLGFGIHETVTDSLLKNVELINLISKERIQDEVNKILLSDPRRGICTMFRFGFLSKIFPCLISCSYIGQNKYHRYNVCGHIVEVLSLSPAVLTLRLAALFHDTGKAETLSIDEDGEIHFYGHAEVSEKIARETMTDLKYDNMTIDNVCWLVANHMFDLSISDKTIRKMIVDGGEGLFMQLIELKRADLKGSGTRLFDEVDESINKFKDRVVDILSAKPPLNMSSLKINGNDIMKITGLKEGKKIGEIKEALFEMVLGCPELNERSILEECVKAKLKKE